MSQEQRPTPNFEQRLLDQLKAIVADRAAAAPRQEAADAATSTPAWRRRRPRLALGAAIALAGVTAALIAGAGGDNPSKAFAVEPQDGGGVTIKVYSLEDAAGLEGALEEAGSRLRSPGCRREACREPHFTPSRVKTPLGADHRRGGPRDKGGLARADDDRRSMSTRVARSVDGRSVRGEISQVTKLARCQLTLDPAGVSPRSERGHLRIAGPYKGDPEGGFGFRGSGLPKARSSPVSGSRRCPTAVPPWDRRGRSRNRLLPAWRHAWARRRRRRFAPGRRRCLRQSDGAVEAPPGPGQFLYAKTKEVHLKAGSRKALKRAGGYKEPPQVFHGQAVELRRAGCPNALVPTLKEVWTAPDGTTRERETLGRVDFLSGADQRLWERRARHLLSPTTPTNTMSAATAPGAR